MPQRIYEYIVPGMIQVLETTDWPEVHLERDGLLLRLKPPIVGQNLTRVAQSLGNEGVEVGYSIARVSVEFPEETQVPEWYTPFQSVRECILWIRAAGRQYWLGAHGTPTRTIARGSIICYSDDQHFTYTNFAATNTPIFVKPLSKQLWEWIGGQMTEQRLPFLTDVFFCDAMVSAADHDYVQAIVRLGVVCELELNAFIEDLLSVQPEKIRRLYRSSKPQFEWKLKNMPEILGAEQYQTANQRFASLLCSLYELRGSAVHKGKCEVRAKVNSGEEKIIPASFGDVSGFLFAVDHFLNWTKAQRARLGVGPAGHCGSEITHTIGPNAG